MKKIVSALLIFVLMIPITAFAATTPTSVSKQTPSTHSMVQLKDLPVMINGVKYTQDDLHVKKVTRFVFDDAAKAEGVVYGFTSQDRLNAYLQSAVTARKTDTISNTITPQAVYYNSYFYEDANYGGNYFGSSSNISWVGSYWNDRISSLTAGYNHNWTVMCWDINYGGAEFWVQSGIMSSSFPLRLAPLPNNHEILSSRFIFIFFPFSVQKSLPNGLVSLFSISSSRGSSFLPVFRSNAFSIK